MEEFKDCVNRKFAEKGLDFNKCNIKNVKINEEILLNKIKKAIK